MRTTFLGELSLKSLSCKSEVAPQVVYVHGDMKINHCVTACYV